MTKSYSCQQNDNIVIVGWTFPLILRLVWIWLVLNKNTPRCFSSWTQGSVVVADSLTSHLRYQVSPSPWSPSSINRLISSGVKQLHSLLFLQAVDCFIIGCPFFSFSHESSSILCVYTCNITLVDLTAATIRYFCKFFFFFYQAAIWRLPNGLNEYCLALPLHLCSD